ncbi:MAG: DUF1294 domain-containing protein [Oscillospiraceae bacterium]|nr:DUF1294 domain-containing protein [Oscillospiraceae bacterium]
MQFIKPLLYPFLVTGISVITAFFYAADKLRAKQRKRRYSERFLLTLGVLFGAPGALIAMAGCRHKTRKRYFWFVNLIGLAGQIGLGWYIYTHR